MGLSPPRKLSRSANANAMSIRMGDRNSALIEDYVTKSNFVESLKDLSHINEEYINKQKIIAMGQILASGVLFKVAGNNHKVVYSFCENIE